MVKTTSLIFTLLLLISCGKSGNGGSGSSNGAYFSQAEAARHFDVQLELENFTAQREDKVRRAADIIRTVVGTQTFRDRIINYTYKGKKAFVDNGGLSNSEIYQRILAGSEVLRPGADGIMNLKLETYRENSMTVGYTVTSELKIYMNTKFLDAKGPADVTTNMMHEWLHKLGFHHAKNSTPSRPHSVPYAIGYLVAEIAEELGLG